MKVLITLAFATLAAATVTLPPDYDPVINEVIKLDDGESLWGLRPLPTTEGYNCWYLRFKVKSYDTVFVTFSDTDGDDGQLYYEVMIGAWENRNTCVRRSNGQWLLDVRTPGILSGTEFTYFYIKQSYNRWEIGYQYGDEIGSFYDAEPYDVRFVGIRSLDWSHWSFYWPGFGRNIFKTDIHNPGEYKWIFPEIRHKTFYMEFAVKAQRDAYIVFSPINDYADDIYEIMVGASDNLFCCIRRKRLEAPIVDVVALDLVDKDEFRYFWVSYELNDDETKSVIKVGRYAEDTPIATYEDSDPIIIRYFGVTSKGCKSWWKFYLLCPDPEYVCEHDQFHMHCDKGLVVVDYALYGRHNNAYCPVRGLGPDDVNCGDPEDNLERIHDACKGQQDCHIDASNEFFGDPCVGTFKYLEIAYHCCVCN